ncbi:MAG TPA: A/G-specific adenine glycosylase [Candidatus Nanoarchaeia archaeon]|nr:A/G-specific adenine glycosylase [Candidatus Nanoarchaeia archaeon]
MGTFCRTVLQWYSRNKRNLPWRRTNDPYRILVSEVMLQQTQVERALQYYAKFLKKFPTADGLARATPTSVLRIWSGLGYNRRALLLQRTAQAAVRGFPRTDAELQQMPGIGPYTAGAILAFAYNQDAVFADTNILRVMERYYYGNKQKSPNQILEKLEELLPRGNARQWYSALMDFGAMVCTARAPRCLTCPLRQQCKAAPHFLRGGLPRVAKHSPEKFEDSNRWWRGQIVKHMVRKKMTAEELYLKIGKRSKRKFTNALRELRGEGLLESRLMDST